MNIEMLSGYSETFIPEIIKRNHQFKITTKDDSIILTNVLCNKQLIRFIKMTLVPTFLLVCTGFYIQNESLIISPISGAIFIMVYRIFSTEKRIIFNGKAKRYEMYNILGISTKFIKFKKIHGIKLFTIESNDSVKIEINFFNKKKSIFGESINILDSIPKLFIELDNQNPSPKEVEDETDKLFEFSSHIVELSGDEILILNEEEE